ncbi:DUF6801 domain-containing protein [Actinocorallia populi]|uniref:DUF6801 domain-containing protein n=1 Tax=Actinocorallia populi TaxID=2079200 RepID=UPI000D08E0DB|nr:DUF6801 domain-containing protein [Actinocorallia populi]
MTRNRQGALVLVLLLALTAVAAEPLARRPARAQAAEADLSYACAFSSGRAKTGVTVSGTFPDTGTAGQPLAPGRITLTLTVPRAALPDAVPAVTADLAMSLVQGTAATPVDWPVFTLPAAPVPESGDVTLTGSAAVPPVTPPAEGSAVFTAGALKLAVGEAVEVSCAPEPGTATAVATIPVASGAAPGTPPECGKIAIDPADPGNTGCAYMTGFANVAKLGAATLLNDPASAGPALTNVIVHPPKAGHLLVDFQFASPLRARSTFLVFGFMPTTAVIEMSQPEKGLVDLSIATGKLTVTGEMEIRITEASINGTPLDIGPRCRGRTPAKIEAVGGEDYGNPLVGGSLNGSFAIPEFIGCGVGEDLSRIFSGAVSGPGNLLKLVQGPVCAPPDPGECPPKVPELRR